MKILSLDSSTESATCAILDDERLLGEITFNYKKQHSVILMSIIDNLLTNLSMNINDLDGFVVSKGPGSFTGLRIGISTIKGLSQGSKKPFIGVSSLDALAYNMAYTPGIVCPILDALRDNVYTALYHFTGNSLGIISDYMVIPVDELIELLNSKKSPVCFIGDGVPKFKEKLSNSIASSSFAPTHLNLVKASSLGEIGITLLREGKQDDLYTFAPVYIRKSQAEREYENRINGV